MTTVKRTMQDIPTEVYQAICERLSYYTVGFLRIKETPEGQEAELLGSGTLVQIEDTHAILTAHHVVEVLPTEGRLCLILSRNLRQHSIDIQGINYVKIARGSVDSEGPDLAGIILSPPTASSIRAVKSFYNLTNYKVRMLFQPPETQEGVWVMNGFVEEKTIQEEGRNGYDSIKGFYLFSGIGYPENDPVVRQGYDYISLPVTYGVDPGVPRKFGGMSGGGLWLVQLVTGPSGKFKPDEYLLSGVMFYQESIENNRSSIVCHGRNSVYKIVYDAIKPPIG